MKRIYFLSFSLALSLLMAPQLWSQQKISLGQYCQQVIDYSQVLKQAEQGVISAENQQDIARTGFLPKLDLVANGSLDLTNLSPWDGPAGTYHPYTYFAGGVLTQNIWIGGFDQANYKAQKLGTEIQLQNQELTLDNIYLQAEIAYWMLSANTAFIQIAQEYYRLILEQKNIIQLRFDDGAIAKNDLLMIQTRLKQAELGMQQAQTSFLVAQQNFNILLGRLPDTPSDSTEGILSAYIAPTIVNLDEALNHRPDYQRAILQVEQLKEQKQLALSGLNPQLYFQATGGFGTANPNLGIDPQGTVIASINFSMPLFHWGERNYTKRQYQALIHSGLYNMQSVEDQASVEIANAQTLMKDRLMQIEVASQTLNLAEESMSLNTFSYNEGRINITDLLSSQLAWIEAYTSLITSHLNYKSAAAQYKKAIGVNP